MANNNYSKIAIGDIGTQLFWFNQNNKKFEYAVPVTAGAEFGGDVESFDAPETDLDYIPKIGGRTTLNDVSYTSNYTAEKYKRIISIIDDTTVNTYMEVFADGSATIFKGTSGRPTITSGDVRQINWTIIPQYMKWIHNIYNLDNDDAEGLESDWYDENLIKIDTTTIPDYRPDYYAKEAIPGGGDDENLRNKIKIVNNSSDTVEIYYEIDKEERGNTFISGGSSETITIDAQYSYYIRYSEGGSENEHYFEGTYQGTSGYETMVYYYDGNICPPQEETNPEWSFNNNDGGTLTISRGKS